MSAPLALEADTATRLVRLMLGLPDPGTAIGAGRSTAAVRAVLHVDAYAASEALQGVELQRVAVAEAQRTTVTPTAPGGPRR